MVTPDAIPTATLNPDATELSLAFVAACERGDVAAPSVHLLPVPVETLFQENGAILDRTVSASGTFSSISRASHILTTS